MATSTKASSLAQTVQVLAMLGIIAGLILISRILPVGQGIAHLHDWLHQLGLVGIVAYILIYIVATVLLVPGAAITLLAGVLYGPLWGTLIVSIGATVGASAAFLLGRFAFRAGVERATGKNPKFRAIDAAIGANGWKIVALLRLSPVVPFNLSNYFFGLTGIGFGPYVLASWICMLPGTLLYVYLGYAASQAAGGAGKSAGWLHWTLVGVGLAIILLVTVYITRLAKRALAGASGVDDMPQTDHSAQPVITGWTKRTTVLAIAAVLMLSLAACTWFKRSALAGLFGPPPVKLVNKFHNRPDGPVFSNREFNSVVTKYVHPGGWVDYAGLASHPQNLNAYIASLAKAPFTQLGRNQKLALLINAYNACTMRLILDYYPHIKSIMDIPSDQRWAAVRWNIGGKLYSLENIELMLRADFADPRIHFAIVCASIGCPPIRQQAYEGDTVEVQLQSQAEYVNNNARWLRFSKSGKTVHLTKLYDWYGGDFTQAAGSVLKFAARYNKQLAAEIAAGNAPAIVFKAYNWNLNSIQNEPSAGTQP